MYRTTGCTDEQIDVICGRIAALILEGEDIEFPSSLGLRRSVVIALTYLKTNRRQAELAEDHGTSQSTISRAIRSEEHTSELQSRQYLVCRLLLEKKKHIKHTPK